jgi:hypothetical protein
VVSIFNQLDGAFRHAGADSRRRSQFREGHIGVNGFLPAPENGGIA